MRYQMEIETSLTPGDFRLLKATLEVAAQRMSKAELLELADGLYDELRARRERGSETRSFNDLDVAFGAGLMKSG